MIRDASSSAAESFSILSGQSQINPLQRNRSDREPEHRLTTEAKKQPATQATTTMKSRVPPAIIITGEPVLLRSLLFNGIISYQLEDLQLWDPALRSQIALIKICFNSFMTRP